MEHGIATVAHQDRRPNDLSDDKGSTPCRAAKKYERIPHAKITTLNLLNGRPSAFDVAYQDYARWSKIPFGEDLLDYLRNGFVVARPNLFGMAKPIEHNGRRGWFIEYGCGNILELISALPCALDFIAFCRKGDDTMRVVDYDSYVRKAIAATRMKARQG